MSAAAPLGEPGPPRSRPPAATHEAGAPPPSRPSCKVFLAHAEIDKAFVAQIKDRLEILARSPRVAAVAGAGRPGIQVFFDQDSLALADASLMAIAQRAAAADVLVLVLPRGGYREGSFVANELLAFLTGVCVGGRQGALPERLSAPEQALARRKAQAIILVDRHDELSWDATRGPAGLPALCSREPLRSLFLEEPPRLRSGCCEVNDVAVAILAGAWGVAPERVYSRVSQRDRRIRRWIASVSAAVIVALAGAAIVARGEQRRAEAALLAEDDAMSLATARWAAAEGRPLTRRALLSRVQRPDALRHWMQEALDALVQIPPYRVLRVPGGAPTVASFSPDGALLVVGTEGGDAYIFSADGRGDPRALLGHTAKVSAASFSPDGRWILTGSHDGTARLWPARGGAAPVVLEGHGDRVITAAFDPAGLKVVTASWDHTARVWAVAGSDPPVVLAGHGGRVFGACFDRAGARVVTRSADGTARVWRADGLGSPVVLAGHVGPVVASAEFDPAGEHVVTASARVEPPSAPGSSGARAELRVYRADGLGEPVVLPEEGSVLTRAAFDATGDLIVSSSSDKTLRLWSWREDKPATALEGHTGLIHSVAFSPGGRQILTAAEDGTARIWRSRGRREAAVLRGHAGKLRQASFNAAGDRVVTVSDDGTVRLWQVAAPGRPSSIALGPIRINAAAFTQDGARLVTGDWDGHLRVRRVDGAGEPLELEGHEQGVYELALGGGDTLVASTSRRPPAKLQPLSGQGRVEVFGGYQGVAKSVAVSADGARVALSSSDDTVRIWDRSGAVVVYESLGKGGQVNALAFSPDGAALVCASEDHSVRVWGVEGAERDRILEGHTNQVRSAAFSQGGDRLVTGSFDRSARVWPADGDGPPVVLRGHQGVVTAVQLSPDGERVVTHATDGTSRVWRAAGDADPLILEGTWGEPLAAHLDPDGARLITLSSDDTLRVWPLTAPGLVAALAEDTEPCLSPDERIRYLGEGREEAWARWRGCEVACWGRSFRGEEAVTQVRCPAPAPPGGP